MKNQKKILVAFSLLIILGVSLSVSSTVFAVVGGEIKPPANTVAGEQKPSGTQTFTLQNPLSSKFDSVGGLLAGFIEIFSYLIILFAVLALIWTGLQYVLARGNPEEMKRLSNQLLYIVIGVAVVIGARLIIEIVINTLAATGTINENVINSTRNAIK